MEKGIKKRKKHTPPVGQKVAKRVRFSLVEDTEKLVARGSPPKDATSSECNTSLSSLRESVAVWMQKQADCNQSDLIALRKENDNSEWPEEYFDITMLEKPIRETLRGYSEEEKYRSFKLECEWAKCKFMTGMDRKYFLHVEAHAEITLEKQNGNYACEWDLCDFITEDSDEFTGHVHFHAYHTKLKVHGASVHLLTKIPSCNNDSRVRNTITNRPVTFRCEWQDCDERFNKAMNFFHHVANHVKDQFEPGKKSSHTRLECGWSLCKYTYQQSHAGLRHVKAHTTERDIGCYNCGTVFWTRVKYVDHCTRQIEMTQRKYQCPECERYYATHKLLRSHMERHDKPHECIICPFKFSSAGMLAQHMAQKHFKERNFKCQQCEYGAFARKDLLKHMTKHDERKLFRCEEFGCDAAYKSEYSLKKHISWHYNLPSTVYECHLCRDKRYHISTELSKHLQFVHKIERPSGQCRYRYKTDGCGVFRLAQYVEQKTKANETPTQKVVPPGEDANNGVGDKKKKSKRNSQQTNIMGKTETASNGAAYVPIKGKLKINSFKSIGLHEFSVELNIDPEPTQSTPKSQTIDSAPAAAATVATTPKEVKDFTVMKRYLKEEKTS